MVRNILNQVFFITIVNVLLTTSTFAQNLTGIWRGYFITESGENYRLEFQIDVNNSPAQGVSYSWFDDIRFYGKATMTGNYDASSKTLRIKEIKTVEVKNATNTVIMNYTLEYAKSGREEYLEGTYLGKPEVKSGNNPYQWGQGGNGKVFLRRVYSTEFTQESFLKKDLVISRPVAPKTNTTVINNPKPLPGNNLPAVKNTIPNNKSKTNNTSVKPKVDIPKNPPLAKNTKPKVNVLKDPTVVTTTPKPKNNTIENNTILTEKIAKEINTTAPDIKVPYKKAPAPAVIQTRKNELIRTLQVSSNVVHVRLYDNGEIDDDTISIYLDNKLILANKRLSTDPITLDIPLDTNSPYHELTMVAENLGRIPPNTSLMKVEAGKDFFDVRITSTEQKNAVVAFSYKGP